jgi:hypothetical protein
VKRAIVLERDSSGEGRAEETESLVVSCWLLIVGYLRLCVNEVEGVGVVSVQKLGDADVVFADDAADAGERQFQFVRCGCDWEKDTGLHCARVHRFEHESESDGWSRRRMRFEIHLQKLQKRFAFAHGDGEADGADVFGAGMLGTVFELQADGHFVRRHGVGKELGALIVEHACDQKQQRFEQADRMIELDTVCIRGFRLEYFERPVDGVASQPMQVDAGGSEALGQAGFGQLSQLLKSVDAPGFEDLGHLFGERERRDIEMVEIGCDGDACEIARCDDGGVGGFGYRDIDGWAGAFGDGLRDLLGRAMQALQTIDAEDNGVGRGLLERWRECLGDLRQVGGMTVNAGEYHASDLALKCAVAGRTGLRDAASNSTSRRSEEPGAPVQMVFLRCTSSISAAQDLAIGCFSTRARMVGVFSMARRNRYQ